MGKELICLSCRQRTCCYYYRVNVTGYDVWRVSKMLDIPSWGYVTYTDAEPDREEAFILDQSGTRYELVLMKTTDPRRFSACVFLLKTNDGEHRCGIGDLRPDQCRIYPVYFKDEVAGVINDTEGCSRVWCIAEIDIDAERKNTMIYNQRKLEYLEVVSQWNQWVWSNKEREFNFYEFCNYLENRYASLYG